MPVSRRSVARQEAASQEVSWCQATCRSDVYTGLVMALTFKLLSASAYCISEAVLPSPAYIAVSYRKQSYLSSGGVLHTTQSQVVITIPRGGQCSSKLVATQHRQLLRSQYWAYLEGEAHDDGKEVSHGHHKSRRDDEMLILIPHCARSEGRRRQGLLYTPSSLAFL